MKHTRSIVSRFRGLAFVLAVAFLSQTASADTSKKWSELNDYLEGKFVIVTLHDGTPVGGRCAGVHGDTIVVRNNSTIQIEHASIPADGIQVDQSNLKAYRRNVEDAFAVGILLLGSESGAILLGILELPVVAVYAVIGAPLNALRDLFHKRTHLPEHVFIVG